VQIIEKKEGQPYITEFHIDQELEERVNRLKQEGNVAQSVEDIYRAFRENGMNRREARQFLKDQMSIEKYMWREIYPRRVNPWVSPEESRYYYRSNIERFTTPVEISLRQVVIFRTRPDAQAAVEGMEQGLRDGVDFVELARMYSQEVLEGLADQAGRVRTYSFEELTSWHDPLPQELRRMKRGEISGPIISPVGIHFFKVEDVISGAPEPFSEAHPKIQRLLRLERNRIAREEFLAEERRKTRVEIRLPPLPENAGQPSGARGGLGGEIQEAGKER
jgi:parvulin-like peptidyl-prolyl isomerase